MTHGLRVKVVCDLAPIGRGRFYLYRNLYYNRKNLKVSYAFHSTIIAYIKFFCLKTNESRLKSQEIISIKLK